MLRQGVALCWPIAALAKAKADQGANGPHARAALGAAPAGGEHLGRALGAGMRCGMANIGVGQGVAEADIHGRVSSGLEPAHIQ